MNFIYLQILSGQVLILAAQAMFDLRVKDNMGYRPMKVQNTLLCIQPPK